VKRWLLSLTALPLVALAGPPLQCDVGPVTKVFGPGPWLVYSCDDATSVVFMSAPGNPAFPSYFIYTFEGTTYRLRGEGNGPKAATDAAYKDLLALSPAEIQALRRETIAVKKP
jgi:hypothetical protein